MKNEERINTFINKFNEDKDYKITDVRDREKLLDELRPKGEWKDNNYDEHVCSICGHYALYGEDPDDYYEEQSNFCPFCGADMRGGEKHD